MLAGDRTAFVLVASARRDTVAEAMFFTDRLAEMGKSPQALGQPPSSSSLSQRPDQGSVSLSDLATADRSRAESLGAESALGAMYSNLADFRQVAKREEEVLAELVARLEEAPVVRIPYLEGDVSDLRGLKVVAEVLGR